MTRLTSDKQKFFETYNYPETDLHHYGSVVIASPVAGAERPSGGIHPDKNIDDKLKVMLDALQPDVARRSSRN